MAPTDSTVAEVLSSNPGKVPVLSAGEIVIETFIAWKDACEDYFEIKDIPEDKRVTHAATGLKDVLIRNWFRADAVRMRALSWDSFAKEFKTRWLPEHWDQVARNHLTRAHQRASDSFNTWITKVETMNAVLVGTEYHKDEEQFRSHVESLLCDRLSQMVATADTHAIKDYLKWRNAIITLDNERLSTMAEILRVTARAAVPAVASAARARDGPISGRSSRTATTPKGDHPPPLTTAERNLLYKHFGCFKCRVFFADHKSAECTTGPPPGANYRELTEADAVKAKAEKDAKDRKNAFKSAKAATAAVGVDDDELLGTAAAVQGRSYSPPASGILGSGSDSDSSDKYVVNLSVPHFLWTGVPFDTKGPCVESPTRMLIDCGSSTVLIRAELASTLGLKMRKLPTPLPLTGAWSSNGITATEFVRLRVASPCLSWTSVAVRAIVVPSLCAPIILGQPFLSANHLVLDCNSRTCVDKRSHFDLLNPTPAILRAPQPDVVPPRQQIEFMISAVRDRAERLALIKRLELEEHKVRLLYEDIFPEDIPHLGELPTNVYHRFKLKDPNLTFARRQYDCPKKYRQAWKSLLDQHLAAGRMRPSDSPYASPSFLIPKKDADAPPRWVNDYRAVVPDV
ncbi:hypothetical protein BDW22DRAFT_1473408 [Trametopsis cervina]|nr:hypothetical protein BDW22DRAFT_1473408 [Trametopsis cervina]